MNDVVERVAEGRPGMLNSAIPKRINLAWQARAATIQRKAEELFRQMMEVVGPDDPLTDYADNIVDAASNIGDCLIMSAALADASPDIGKEGKY